MVDANKIFLIEACFRQGKNIATKIINQVFK